jgi:hypothetical protein
LLLFCDALVEEEGKKKTKILVMSTSANPEHGVIDSGRPEEGRSTIARSLSERFSLGLEI